MLFRPNHIDLIKQGKLDGTTKTIYVSQKSKADKANKMQILQKGGDRLV